MAQRGAAGVTFSLIDEDHTIGNSVRYVLNQDPRVTFCGYSVPHPSDSEVNIRVQTTGEAAREVLKEGLLELAGFCEHVTRTFDAAFDQFERRRRGETVEEEEDEGEEEEGVGEEGGDEDMEEAS